MTLCAHGTAAMIQPSATSARPADAAHGQETSPPTAVTVMPANCTASDVAGCDRGDIRVRHSAGNMVIRVPDAARPRKPMRFTASWASSRPS